MEQSRPTEKIHLLETDMLELFAQKSRQGQSDIAQPCNANGLKVRRIMQIIRDLAGNAEEDIRVLDVACGEGVFAIETALRGIQIHAFGTGNIEIAILPRFAKIDNSVRSTIPLVSGSPKTIS